MDRLRQVTGLMYKNLRVESLWCGDWRQGGCVWGLVAEMTESKSP